MILKFKNLFSIIIVRNIFIIFLIGLVVRFLINYIWDVNVFKEYASYISLTYYSGMAIFSVFINDLLSLKGIIIDLFHSMFLDKQVIGPNSNYFSPNVSKDLSKHPIS